MVATNCEVIETHGDTAMVLKSYTIILLHGEFVLPPPSPQKRGLHGPMENVTF